MTGRNWELRPLEPKMQYRDNENNSMYKPFGSRRPSWLSEHLNNFVLPVLGYIPTKINTQNYFTPEEMSVIKNCWRSAKSASRGKNLILAGRDVYIFEILARRENFSTKFIPECSRQTVSFIRHSVENPFLVDTGFMGSIPIAMNIDAFKLLSSYDRTGKVQIFPNLSMSRALALKIENTSKYWKSGRIRYKGEDVLYNYALASLYEKEVFQEFSNKEEFCQAAILTQEIYKDSSPAFVDHPKPLNIEKGSYEHH